MSDHFQAPGFEPDPANDGQCDVYHRDGVPFTQAPVLPSDHLCEVQTDGWRYITHFQRCACGAYRFPGRSSKWVGRNTRKAS